MNLDQEEKRFFQSEESSFRYQSIIQRFIRLLAIVSLDSIFIFLIGS